MRATVNESQMMKDTQKAQPWLVNGDSPKRRPDHSQPTKSVCFSNHSSMIAVILFHIASRTAPVGLPFGLKSYSLSMMMSLGKRQVISSLTISPSPPVGEGWGEGGVGFVND